MSSNFGTPPTARDPLPTPAPTDPFRIAVLGDFSGRGGFDQLKPVGLDADDLDVTLAAVAPAATLDGLDGGDAALSFAALDDFEPDALNRAVDHFSDLSDEDEKAAFLKTVLRHPAFRRLEASWRGVDWLARKGRRGDRRAEIVLFDVPFDALAAAVGEAEDIAAGPLYQALVEKAVYGKKGQPWAAVVGLYSFDLTAAHAELLGRIARTLTDAGGPFLAGLSAAATDPTTAVDEADAEAWTELRSLAEAGLIGLTAPRFLLRRPYGENGKTVDAFSFEEFGGPHDADAYLWADPGLAAAAVLAQGYLSDGWGFIAQGTLTLEHMPTHAYRDADDDDHLTLLDRWLDRKAAERLSKYGVMTVQAVKNKDTAQLTRIHSLGGAVPPADLYGRWGKSGSAGPPRSRFGVSVVMDAAAPGVKSAPAAAASSDDSSGSSDTSSSSDSSDSSYTPSADDTPPADSSSSDLDAMLAAMETPADDSPPPEEPPPPADEAPAADVDLDAEIAAMMKAMENP